MAKKVKSNTDFDAVVVDFDICSSSTPPGGGMPGLCCYHAAKRGLENI